MFFLFFIFKALNSFAETESCINKKTFFASHFSFPEGAAGTKTWLGLVDRDSY